MLHLRAIAIVVFVTLLECRAVRSKAQDYLTNDEESQKRNTTKMLTNLAWSVGQKYACTHYGLGGWQFCLMRMKDKAGAKWVDYDSCFSKKKEMKVCRKRRSYDYVPQACFSADIQPSPAVKTCELNGCKLVKTVTSAATLNDCASISNIPARLLPRVFAFNDEGTSSPKDPDAKRPAATPVATPAEATPAAEAAPAATVATAATAAAPVATAATAAATGTMEASPEAATAAPASVPANKGEGVIEGTKSPTEEVEQSGPDAVPTTATPTTGAPTTAAPTTAAPTTAAPTNAVPLTATPTTVAPATATPTTATEGPGNVDKLTIVVQDTSSNDGTEKQASLDVVEEESKEDKVEEPTGEVEEKPKENTVDEPTGPKEADAPSAEKPMRSDPDAVEQEPKEDKIEEPAGEVEEKSKEDTVDEPSGVVADAPSAEEPKLSDPDAVEQEPKEDNVEEPTAVAEDAPSAESDPDAVAEELTALAEDDPSAEPDQEEPNDVAENVQNA